MGKWIPLFQVAEGGRQTELSVCGRREGGTARRDKSLAAYVRYVYSSRLPAPRSGVCVCAYKGEVSREKQELRRKREREEKGARGKSSTFVVAVTVIVSPSPRGYLAVRGGPSLSLV